MKYWQTTLWISYLLLSTAGTCWACSQDWSCYGNGACSLVPCLGIHSLILLPLPVQNIYWQNHLLSSWNLSIYLPLLLLCLSEPTHTQPQTRPQDIPAPCNWSCPLQSHIVSIRQNQKYCWYIGPTRSFSPSLSDITFYAVENFHSWTKCQNAAIFDLTVSGTGWFASGLMDLRLLSTSGLKQIKHIEQSECIFLNAHFEQNNENSSSLSYVKSPLVTTLWIHTPTLGIRCLKPPAVTVWSIFYRIPSSVVALATAGHIVSESGQALFV